MSYTLLVRGRHLNAIAFMSSSGINCHIEDGPVDGDQFYLCSGTSCPISCLLMVVILIEW